MRFMQQEPVVGPMNIGNPGEFTILELAEKVIALTNSASKIVYRPMPSDDPQQRKPDIEQAKSVLGWEPPGAVRGRLKKRRSLIFLKGCRRAALVIAQQVGFTASNQCSYLKSYGRRLVMNSPTETHATGGVDFFDMLNGGSE